VSVGGYLFLCSVASSCLYSKSKDRGKRQCHGARKKSVQIQYLFLLALGFGANHLILEVTVPILYNPKLREVCHNTFPGVSHNQV
jgi:hypothetical protein